MPAHTHTLYSKVVIQKWIRTARETDMENDKRLHYDTNLSKVLLQYTYYQNRHCAGYKSALAMWTQPPVLLERKD